MESVAANDFAKLLIVLPNWVGDVVLATPVLRAIRRHLPDSDITYLMRSYVQDVLHSSPWMNRVVCWPGTGKGVRDLLRLSQELRPMKFSAALLLTNSFRTACLAWLSRASRRIGYARDYRAFLLTDRLLPAREGGRYKVESMIDYYARLGEHVGCPDSRGPLELHTDADSDLEIERWWQEFEFAGDEPVVVLNPGAAFGASKLYPADRFAAVGRALVERLGVRILITAGPADLESGKAVCAELGRSARVLAPPRLNLRLLKSLIARSSLLITNDTGPRHFAIAFGVPVVTIFGPTHPGWTETNCAYERKVMIPVDCGPCQKPVCPLDHRCMTGLSPQLVIEQAEDLLRTHMGGPRLTLRTQKVG